MKMEKLLGKKTLWQKLTAKKNRRKRVKESKYKVNNILERA